MSTNTNATQASTPRKASVFISYAREERPFVTDMRAKLAERGIEAKGDWQLQPGVRYQEELRAAIVSCDTFLFVITRFSVVSEPCRVEIDFANEQNKRLSPVVREDVPDEAIHPA